MLDCDRAGRHAATRIADDLKAAGVRGSIVDLAADRHDGYDLTDWLDAQFVTGATAPRLLRHAAAAQPTLGPDGSSRPNEPTLTGSRWAQDPPATPCSAPTQPSPGSVRHHPGVSTH